MGLKITDNYISFKNPNKTIRILKTLLRYHLFKRTMKFRKGLTAGIYCLDTSRIWNRLPTASSDPGVKNDIQLENEFVDSYLIHDNDWFCTKFILGDIRISHTKPSVSFMAIGDDGPSENAYFAHLPATKTIWKSVLINSLDEIKSNGAEGDLHRLLTRLNDRIDYWKSQGFNSKDYRFDVYLTLPTAISRTRDNKGRLRNLVKEAQNNPNDKKYKLLVKSFSESGKADSSCWPINLNINYYIESSGFITNNNNNTLEMIIDNPDSDEYIDSQNRNGNPPIYGKITSCTVLDYLTSYGISTPKNQITSDSPAIFPIRSNYWDINDTIGKYDFKTNTGILNALKWYIDSLSEHDTIRRWNELFPNLNLAGLCMVCENPTYQYDVEVINGLKAYMLQDKKLNWELIVSPYDGYYEGLASGKSDNLVFPKNKLTLCDFDNIYYQINNLLDPGVIENLSPSQKLVLTNSDLDINVAIKDTSFKDNSHNVVLETLKNFGFFNRTNYRYRNIMLYDDAGTIYRIKSGSNTDQKAKLSEFINKLRLYENSD